MRHDPNSDPIDWAKLTALVVDDNGLSRAAYVRFLQALGVRRVLQASTPEAARPVVLRHRQSVDIVVCEAAFNKGAGSVTGLDFMQELREAGHLPLSAACLLVTSESRYQHVLDALEERVDDYLLKPVTQGSFEARLRLILNRKAHLQPVYRALQNRAVDEAAHTCLQLSQARGEHWLAAAKLGTDLLLGCGRAAQAKQLLLTVDPHDPPEWARLGLAQALLESSESRKAIDVLEEVISQSPNSAEAHDMLCRAYLEEHRLSEAIVALERAVMLAPGNVSRRQRLGALLQLKGATRQAHQHLSQSFVLGRQTRAYNYLGLVQLAMTSLELGEPRVWDRAQSLVQSHQVRGSRSVRLDVLGAMLELVEALEADDDRAAQRAAQVLVEGCLDTRVDFDTAATTFLLLTRACGLLPADTCAQWVRAMARKYAHNRGTLELLGQSCAGQDLLKQAVTEAGEEIQALAQNALSPSLAGEHDRSLANLLDTYASTGNQRFLLLAKASLDKHANTFAAGDVARWREQIESSLGRETPYVLRGVGRRAGQPAEQVATAPTVAMDMPAQDPAELAAFFEAAQVEPGGRS